MLFIHKAGCVKHLTDDFNMLIHNQVDQLDVRLYKNKNLRNLLVSVDSWRTESTEIHMN